jgi:hypothetical protein
MKPYFSKPTKLIRVNISQEGCDTEHLMFQDCDLLQCAQELMGFSHEMVTSADSNPYDKKLTIQCREWENSRNGLSNTFSFFGPSPSSMKGLILRHFGYGLEYEDK